MWKCSSIANQEAESLLADCFAHTRQAVRSNMLHQLMLVDVESHLSDSPICWWHPFGDIQERKALAFPSSSFHSWPLYACCRLVQNMTFDHPMASYSTPKILGFEIFFMLKGFRVQRVLPWASGSSKFTQGLNSLNPQKMVEFWPKLETTLINLG